MQNMPRSGDFPAAPFNLTAGGPTFDPRTTYTLEVLRPPRTEGANSCNDVVASQRLENRGPALPQLAGEARAPVGIIDDQSVAYPNRRRDPS